MTVQIVCREKFNNSCGPIPNGKVVTLKVQCDSPRGQDKIGHAAAAVSTAVINCAMLAFKSPLS